MEVCVKAIIIDDFPRCLELEEACFGDCALDLNGIKKIYTDKKAVMAGAFTNNVLIGFIVYELSSETITITRITTDSETQAFEYLINNLIASLRLEKRHTIEILVDEYNIQAAERLQALGFFAYKLYKDSTGDFIAMRISLVKEKIFEKNDMIVAHS